jgi:TIGR02436 family protein
MKRNGETGRMRWNIVQEKSFALAVKIIKASRHLRLECSEPVLSMQLLRSGTSIGANIEEAIAAQSKKDVLAKMSISMKEARETHYWLRLLKESRVMDHPDIDTLLQECGELVNLLSSITLTTRQNLKTDTRDLSSTRRNSTFHFSHSTFDGGGVS